MPSIEDLILKLAEEKKGVRSTDIATLFTQGVSRQYIHRVVKNLVDEGKLVKIGKTRKTYYAIPEYVQEAETLRGKLFSKRLQNKNLAEHEVLNNVRDSAQIIADAPEHIQSIFDYAFSEMLNNAIEHSTSKYVDVEVAKSGDDLLFVVNDFGIGVFKNVMQKKGLRNELEAIQDLLKGKTTTEPRSHSGEGIFFTSKVADVFTLDSFEYRLKIDNTLPDVFIVPLKHPKEGTKVTFSINLKTNRHLNDIFKAYQTEQGDLGFDKTEVKIKLYIRGTIYISRSQARRILTGLDKFTYIILDYEKVPTIGQAFADEIYRVFQTKYPNIRIKSTNTNEVVQFMIDRVDKPKTLFKTKTT